MSNLQVNAFAGREANVNAYIVHNDTHAIVVDCLRNREEADELAAEIAKTFVSRPQGEEAIPDEACRQAIFVIGP